MLPPFIIEQIRKREEDSREKREQPTIRIPMAPVPPREDAREDDADRGVVIIDLVGS
ncbi:MAG: hypothetical protein AAGE52_09740 [Myxococcota bacterium]